MQVTPDQAVQYEALLAGIGMRDVLGVQPADNVRAALDAVGGPQQATLRLVLDMLLPDEAGKQAAAAIEECVLVSWVGVRGALSSTPSCACSTWQTLLDLVYKAG
jgi:hypothetical protein